MPAQISVPRCHSCHSCHWRGGPISRVCCTLTPRCNVLRLFCTVYRHVSGPLSGGRRHDAGDQWPRSEDQRPWIFISNQIYHDFRTHHVCICGIVGKCLEGARTLFSFDARCGFGCERQTRSGGDVQMDREESVYRSFFAEEPRSVVVEGPFQRGLFRLLS